MRTLLPRQGACRDFAHLVVAPPFGAGSASVTVTVILDAPVTGAGSMTFAGSPVVTSSVTGVGSIRQSE